MTPPRILQVHNVRAHYRDPLFARLARRWRQRVVFWGEGGAPAAGPARGAPAYEAVTLRGGTLRRAAGLAEELSRQPWDAVIASWDGRIAVPLSWAFSRLRRRPWIVWHGTWDPPRSLAHRLTAPLQRWLLRRADAVLTYGAHTRRTLVALGVRARRIVIAPQTVDNAAYARPVDARRVAALRAALRGRAARLALFVGRLVPEKGLEDLTSALARLPRGSWRLALVGSGPLARRWMTERRDGRDLVVVGDRAPARLAEYYAAADALVLPSITTRTFREPWGLVVNEAMTRGLPVVATDAVGAAAGGLAVHGETALVVPERDPVALAAALERLRREPGLARRLGAEGRRRIGGWTYPRMAEAFERALGLARRPAPPLSKRRCLVSLSFDDGVPEDVALARLLARKGLRATFYVPLANSERGVLDAAGIRRLRDLGHEVGAHGLTHRRFTTLPERAVRRELFLSRQRLEAVLGAPVRGFAFPGGRHARRHRLLAAQAGYDYCRTIAMFRNADLREGNALHTTLQLYPHGAAAYGRHLLRQGTPAAWASAARAGALTGAGLVPMVKRLFDRALARGEPFHLWGHAWEIGRGLPRRDLEEILEFVSRRRGVACTTNAELFDDLLDR